MSKTMKVPAEKRQSVLGLAAERFDAQPHQLAVVDSTLSQSAVAGA